LRVRSEFAQLTKTYNQIVDNFNNIFPYNPQAFESMKQNKKLIEKYTPIIPELKTKIQTLQNYQNNEEKQPTNISYQEYKNAYNEIKNQLDKIQRAINRKKV